MNSINNNGQPLLPLSAGAQAPYQNPLLETALARVGAGASGARPQAERMVAGILRSSSMLPAEDQAILLAIAEQESNFDVTAQNPGSSAHGIFQIIDDTWRQLGFSTSARSDPAAQIEAGLALYRDNLRCLAQRGLADIHGAARLVEMYVLHHDGPSGYEYGGREIALKYVLPKFRRYETVLRAHGALSKAAK